MPAAKPATAVALDARLTVAEDERTWVSRGAHKLIGALDAFGIDVTGRRCLDAGASTGGFTEVLLDRGAVEVVAADVGYGQLAWSLREDPRVDVLDRTNARALQPAMLPRIPNLLTMDVAFISSALVWPAVAACLDAGYRALVMVKPQFEVGRENVGSGGVVRDPVLRRDAVMAVAGAVAATGGQVAGAADSGTPGPRGNREIFLLVHGPDLPPPGVDLAVVVDAAVAEAGP